MIKKLENAGLGFYVRETDTNQKLGNLYNKVSVMLVRSVLVVLYVTCSMKNEHFS